MSNTESFTGQDLLDSLLRVALTPTAAPAIRYDHEGHPQIDYQLSDPIVGPFVHQVRKLIETNEEFQMALINALLANIDTIAEGLVDKITKGNTAFGIAKEQAGYGRDSGYRLAEWLQAPVGAALANALEPRLIEHFNGEDGKPNFGGAKLDVKVTVNP